MTESHPVSGALKVSKRLLDIIFATLALRTRRLRRSVPRSRRKAWRITYS